MNFQIIDAAPQDILFQVLLLLLMMMMMMLVVLLLGVVLLGMAMPKYLMFNLFMRMLKKKHLTVMTAPMMKLVIITRTLLLKHLMVISFRTKVLNHVMNALMILMIFRRTLLKYLMRPFRTTFLKAFWKKYP